jgi:hypothetical protein
MRVSTDRKTGKHIDGIGLLEEAIGEQGLSSGIGSLHVRMTKDADEVVDNGVGIVLAQTLAG